MICRLLLALVLLWIVAAGLFLGVLWWLGRQIEPTRLDVLRAIERQENGP